MRAALAALASTFALAACGPSGPFLPCARACRAEYNCPPGEPNRTCEAALAECIDDCRAVPGEEAQSGEGADDQ